MTNITHGAGPHVDICVPGKRIRTLHLKSKSPLSLKDFALVLSLDLDMEPIVAQWRANKAA